MIARTNICNLRIISASLESAETNNTAAAAEAATTTAALFCGIDGGTGTK